MSADPRHDICRCGCPRHRHSETRHSETTPDGPVGVAWTRWCPCEGFEKAADCPYVDPWLGRRCALWEGHGSSGHVIHLQDPGKAITVGVIE